MKIRAILAAAATIAAVSFQFAPNAEAQGTATARVKNDAAYTIDCRIVMGTLVYGFPGVAPGSISDEKAMPVNTNDRTLVCKKSGVAPSLTTQSVVKFKADTATRYTAACSGSDKLSCTIAPDGEASPNAL